MLGNSGIAGIFNITGIPTVDLGAAYVLLAVYLFGVTCGVVVAVSHASRLEERWGTLTREAPGTLALGARTFLSATILGTGFVSDRHGGDGTGAGDGNGPGQGPETRP
jgi:hypothetical protein